MKNYLEDFLAFLALILLTAICAILAPFLLPCVVAIYLVLYNKMKNSGDILIFVWGTILVSGGILCWEYLF